MGIEFKKNDKLTKIVTAILVGVLLLIIFIPINNEEKLETSNTSNEVNSSWDYESYSDYYETRLKEILEESYGTGTMNVMVRVSEYSEGDTTYISYDEKNEVTVDGVLIVADVNSEQAVSDITFAVCALFDLPAHKVAVMIKN